MITYETARRILGCYREIEAANKLLSDMEEVRKNRSSFDKTAIRLRDHFGDERDLQLGIPTGGSGHQLIGVSSDLGESIIRSHRAKKEAELVEANEQARIELDMPAAPFPQESESAA